MNKDTPICYEPQIIIVTPPLITLNIDYYVGVSVALAAEHDFLVFFSSVRPNVGITILLATLLAGECCTLGILLSSPKRVPPEKKNVVTQHIIQHNNNNNNNNKQHNAFEVYADPLQHETVIAVQTKRNRTAGTRG